MKKRPAPKPTDAELAILRVLWERGPSTVRQVHDIVAEKGLTLRDETGRSHVYEAVQGEAETQRWLLDDLLDRAFGGSAAKLVMQALATRPASEAEGEEIRRLIAARLDKEKDRDGRHS
jgi:BlaI family penicillinase repressor